MGLPSFPRFGMLQPTGQTFVMIVRFLVKGAAAKDDILSSPRVDSKKLQIRARSKTMLDISVWHRTGLSLLSPSPPFIM